MANTYDMTVLPLFLDSDTTTRTLAFEAAFSLLQSESSKAQFKQFVKTKRSVGKSSFTFIPV
jgi:hypothetical protein